MGTIIARLGKQYALILASLLVLVTFWEFGLEELSFWPVELDGEPESAALKIEYVLTVMAFGVVALIVPFFWAVRAEKKRCQIEEQREKLVEELQKTLGELKILKGIIPICSYCKKIRNESGAWDRLEAYIHSHSEACFSHGICPECYEKEMVELNAIEEAMEAEGSGGGGAPPASE